MIQITPQMRILVAVEPTDFRRGIDGLGGVCRRELEQDPLSGCVFVFRNRRGTAVKILMYDGQGFWLCQKRLSKGRFRWWPRLKPGRQGEDLTCELAARDLQVLLWDGDPKGASMSPMWRSIDGKG